MVYLLDFFMPELPELLKSVQHLNYLLQGFKDVSPDFNRILDPYKKKLLLLFLHHVCSGSNIILSMPSIFLSISLIVLFHIDSSASSSFLNELMLPRVSLISLILDFIMSKTSKISLYSSILTKTGAPALSCILILLK